MLACYSSRPFFPGNIPSSGPVDQSIKWKKVQPEEGEKWTEEEEEEEGKRRWIIEARFFTFHSSSFSFGALKCAKKAFPGKSSSPHFARAPSSSSTREARREMERCGEDVEEDGKITCEKFLAFFLLLLLVSYEDVSFILRWVIPKGPFSSEKNAVFYLRKKRRLSHSWRAKRTCSSLFCSREEVVIRPTRASFLPPAKM